MNWHYAEGDQRHGPVTEAQLAELVSAGRITGETLVWQPGMNEWQAYRTVGKPSVAGPPPLSATCVRCQQRFPMLEMLQFQTGWICAGCKPHYVQSLKEGAPLFGSGRVGRIGPLLVMEKAAILPDRCVRCNAPANGSRLDRKLSWHHPAYYFLILPGLLIYAIVAMAVSEKAKIQVGLCGLHRAKRKQAILIAWLLFAAAIGVFVLSGVFEAGGLALLGILLLAASPIYGAVGARVVAAQRIDKRYVWLKGVAADYLDSLPDLNGKL